MFSKRSSILLLLSLILCSSITMAADCGKCQNCKTINSKNECVQCIDGYRLDPTGSMCIKTQMTSLPGSIRQSSGFTSSTTEISRSSSSSVGAGLNIDPNCDIIENNGICRKCVDRFFLNSTTKRCQAVSPLCKEWSSKGKCLSCVTGYSVNLDSECVPAAQKQQPKNKNTIDQRLEDLFKLNDGSTMINADDAFKLLNELGSQGGSKSQSQISTSRSSTTITRSNSSSGAAASNSNRSSSLTQAPLSTLLNNIPITSTQKSLVVSTISDGLNNVRLQQVRRPDPLASAINFDFSKFNGQIFTVDPFCERYQGRVCKNCQLRYVMIQGRCQRVSNTCSEWEPTGKCTVCYSGFNLNGKGQCVRFIIDQSLQTFQGAVKIDGVDSNSSNTSSGANTSRTTTTTTSSTTTTTRTTGTQPATTGVVATISLGPQTVTPAVQNCDQVGENGLCVRCKFRFYNQKGVCKAVSQLCSAWSLTTGACTECYEGFQVSGTTCQKIQPKKQQVAIVDPNQISAEQQFQQFMARFRRKIEQQNQIPIPNCALAKKGYCEICAFKYYNMNGICMAVSDLCNTYDQKTGECTSCRDGFVLSGVSRGICNPKPLQVPVPSIVTSTYGSLNNEELSKLNKKAQQIKFQTQSSFRNANRVLDDLNQIQLKQQQMQQLQQLQNQIPNFNKFVDNNIVGCQEIGVSGLCTRCAFRYVKSNGGCKQVSDLCKSWNTVNGGCTQCYDGYGLKGLQCVLAKNMRRI